MGDPTGDGQLAEKKMAASRTTEGAQVGQTGVNYGGESRIRGFEERSGQLARMTDRVRSCGMILSDLTPNDRELAMALLQRYFARF